MPIIYTSWHPTSVNIKFAFPFNSVVNSQLNRFEPIHTNHMDYAIIKWINPAAVADITRLTGLCFVPRWHLVLGTIVRLIVGGFPYRHVQF